MTGLGTRTGAKLVRYGPSTGNNRSKLKENGETEINKIQSVLDM